MLREFFVLSNIDAGFEEQAGCGIFTFRTKLHCRMQTAQMTVLVREDNFSTLTAIPLAADKNSRLAVAEYLTRVNFNMRNGNFELDMETGEIRFKTYVHVGGGRPDRGATRLADAVLFPFLMLDRFGDGLLEVLFGFKSPRGSSSSPSSGQDKLNAKGLSSSQHRYFKRKTKYFCPKVYGKGRPESPLVGRWGKAPYPKMLRCLFLEMFGLSLTAPYSFGCVRPKGLRLTACPERAGRLLAAAILAPRMHDQRQRNHAVADEHAEILADGRVAKEVLARRRGEDEHQVEQHAADERLRVGRADHGSAADQNRRARVQADLLVRAVGLEGPCSARR